MTAMTAHAPAHTLVIVPCAAAKLSNPAPARDLYASANFKHALACAQTHAAAAVDSHGQPVTAEVMILSAEHGLVALDDVLAPYDTTMSGPHSVTAAGIAAQLAELAPAAIESMLPSAYRDRLAAAVELSNDDDANEWIEFLDAYEAAPGIGYQRGVLGSLARCAA